VLLKGLLEESYPAEGLSLEAPCENLGNRWNIAADEASNELATRYSLLPLFALASYCSPKFTISESTAIPTQPQFQPKGSLDAAITL